MELKLAKTAGFCFGVKRAMNIALEQKGEGIYTLGPLIHNTQAVNRLREQGIIPADNIDEIPCGSKVIIRTHGVGKDIYEQLFDKQIEVIDATCPYVKKIHNIVSENYKKGYNIVIAGDENHPEVMGINGWCDNSAVIIKNECFNIDFESSKKYCFVAQTTFSLDIWNKIKKA